MSDETSGAMTNIVAMVAIVIILGIGYFVFQNMQENVDSALAINVILPSGDNE